MAKEHIVFSIRLSEVDQRRLAKLRKKLELQWATIVRQGIKILAEKEGCL